MARRRHRRRRRGFGDLVSLPALGGFKLPKARDLNPLGKSVNTTDVAIGAAIGMGGGALVKIAVNKLDEWSGGKVPGFLRSYLGPISTVLAGLLAASFVKNEGKRKSYYVGAFFAGAVPLAWAFLARQFPAYFSDLVDVNLGLVVNEDYAGLLVDEPGMAELAAYSFPDDEDILDAA